MRKLLLSLAARVGLIPASDLSEALADKSRAVLRAAGLSIEITQLKDAARQNADEREAMLRALASQDVSSVRAVANVRDIWDVRCSSHQEPENLVDVHTIRFRPKVYEVALRSHRYEAAAWSSQAPYFAKLWSQQWALAVEEDILQALSQYQHSDRRLS